MFVYSWEARPQNRPPLGNDISRLGSELLRIPVTRLHNVYEYSRIDILDHRIQNTDRPWIIHIWHHGIFMESGAYLPLQVVVKPWFPLIFQAIHGKCCRRQWRKIAFGSRRQFPTPKWVRHYQCVLDSQIATGAKFTWNLGHQLFIVIPFCQYMSYILSYCFSASLVTIWDHEICWFLINDRRYQEIFGFVWK